MADFVKPLTEARGVSSDIPTKNKGFKSARLMRVFFARECFNGRTTTALGRAMLSHWNSLAAAPGLRPTNPRSTLRASRTRNCSAGARSNKLSAMCENSFRKERRVRGSRSKLKCQNTKLGRML